jgi:hypothetical protein
LYLVVCANDEIQVNSWEDVQMLGAQGIVLVNNGFGILDRLDEIPGIRIDAGANTTKANLTKLLAERGRFFYHRSPGIEAEIQAAGMQEKFKVLPAVMHAEKLYLAVSNKLPRETIERLRKSVAELDHSGELARRVKKWSGAVSAAAIRACRSTACRSTDVAGYFTRRAPFARYGDSPQAAAGHH